MLFGLISSPVLRGGALRALLAASGCRECVEDVAASNVLGPLLRAAAEPANNALSALAALLANTAIVKEALSKGKTY